MQDDQSAIMYAEDAGLTARNQMDPEQPIKKIQLVDDDGNPIRFSSGAGQQGPAGAAAGFGTPTATVDQTTGTASVTVSASGPDTAKVFAFKFTGIKGEKGDKGDTGAAGAPGTSYTLPAATTAALGGVKKATAVADPTASAIGTVTALEGDSVTVANVNAVITSLNTTIGALNDLVTKQKQLLANLRTAGVIEES